MIKQLFFSVCLFNCVLKENEHRSKVKHASVCSVFESIELGVLKITSWTQLPHFISTVIFLNLEAAYSIKREDLS